MINAKTKLCCIIGNPVEHSKSPLMHNAAYKALGLNFAFLAFRVTDVKNALEGLRAIDARGIVVTIPHKQEVMNYVDEVDETARQIGAVNTIVNENGILRATNTDWTGAMRALKEKTEITGKIAAVLGAGGAARAIIYGLKKESAQSILIFNRTIKNAQKLAQEFAITGGYSLENEDMIKQADIVINTTSVGMEPHEGVSPISENIIHKDHVVFDIVYTPRETKLLQLGKKKSATIVHGDKMLLYGAIAQFELFTGQKAPQKVMEDALC